MGVDLARQLHVALGAALLGVGISLFFEAVRVVGHFLRGSFWRFVLDLVRVVAAVLATLSYFQRSADGQIRWYDIGALVLSAWLFHFCLGRFLVRPLCRLLSFFAAVLKKLAGLIWLPLGLMLRFLGKGAGFFTKITAAFFKKVFIFLKRYIIMIPYPLFLKRKKVKEVPHGRKTEEAAQGNISQFYH